MHKIVTFIQALWIKLESILTLKGDDSAFARTSWMSQLLRNQESGTVWEQEHSNMLNFRHQVHAAVPLILSRNEFEEKS